MAEHFTFLHHEPWSSFISGFITHTAIKTVLAPIDRAGVILQTQDYTEAPVVRYNSATEVLKTLPSKQGKLSFWRGNLIHCLRYIPNQLANVYLAGRIRSVFKVSGSGDTSNLSLDSFRLN